MTSNLLVSQLNKQKNQTTGYLQNTGFDESVINAQNLIHAQKPVGELVHSNIFTAPVRFVKDLCTDTVSLSQAIKTGKSDDYKLGRVNDLTLKLGSLGIAGYLFTKRPQTTQKYMELVGFGSFFASMALWPKLFIQLPAKLIHGIDVFQEYKDSQGRQKRFFLDPQYTPWDIITPKQMDKLGDRLNIPRNVKNRSDLTKEKMHKIALQSNTMWMLSAGLGVPIMSAFICSGVERFLPKYVIDNKLSKSNNKISSLLSKNIDDIKANKDVISGFKKFMSANKNAVVSDDFYTKLAKAVTGSDKFTKTFVEEMKANPLFTSKKKISDNTINKMFEAYAIEFEDLGITKEKFLSNFNRDVSEENQITNLIKALRTSTSKPNKLNRNDISAFVRKMPLEGSALSPAAVKKLESLNEIFAKFTTIDNAVTENLLLKSGQSADALATKFWKDFNNKLVKVVNLSPEEIKTFSASNSEAIDLLNLKFASSLKSPKSYEEQFNLLFNVFKDYGNAFYDKGNLNCMSKEYNDVFKLFGMPESKLRSVGFPKLADSIIFNFGEDVKTKNAPSYAKSLYLDLIELPTTAKTSAFARNLLTLDFYKRKIDGELPGQIEQITRELFNGLTLSKEDILAYQNEAEKILLDADLGKFITRFNHQGESKVKYNVIMNLLYNTDNLSSKTKEIISKEKSNNPASALFEKFLNDMKNVVGNIRNRHFSSLNIDNQMIKPVNLQPAIHDVKIGDNMISMLNKTYETANNTKIWTKKFAVLGISVAAITVLSQLFFGNIKNVKTNSKSKEAA